MNKHEINNIFVYGTLMSGFRNHDKYLSGHIIEKYQGIMKGKLYHLKDGFPAASDGEGRITGEICLVRDIEKMLPVLDNLEDYNQPGREDLYKREIREVRDDKGNIILCYVYLWVRQRLSYLKNAGLYINHGDWKKFLQDNNFLLEEG